jgi:hypothetical protein
MSKNLRALLVPGLLLVRVLVRAGLILMGAGILFFGLVTHYIL